MKRVSILNKYVGSESKSLQQGKGNAIEVRRNTLIFFLINNACDMTCTLVYVGFGTFINQANASKDFLLSLFPKQQVL